MRRALAAALLLLALSGCRRYRAANAGDCQALFERIFALEFAEVGFRDPVLAARKRSELASRLGPQIEACRGVRLAVDGLACAAQARSTDEVSHRCLR